MSATLRRAVLFIFLLPLPLGADGGVTFVDVAEGDGAGIAYRRTPSESKAIFDAIKADPPYGNDKRLATPMKAWGAPGVALFDYDGDGDLDIYVTNGPGTANSLYSNQLVETGETAFVDVAAEAGVDAAGEDSTGVCFGDLDNDGDPDLLVLAIKSPGRLFENLGRGADGRVTFADITAASGLGAAAVRSSSSCSMGDVDGDGLLDLAIANTYDSWDHFRGIYEPFAFNEHNQLFLNAGGNVFVEASAASGIEELAGFPAGAAGAAGLTWAIALVDVDLDGDVDLLAADDQGGVPSAATLGVDRGLLHLMLNDGTGRFTDVTPEAGLAVAGSWMGLAFADFNCDGRLDFFATDFGDYVPFAVPEPGRQPSRWFLGRADGGFDEPGVGELVTTPFGWGASPFDYDNDGDIDVVFHGGLDSGPGIEAANPGVVLQNRDCTAAFAYDAAALEGSTDHGRRIVHGVAVGDLDANGFVDVVSVSNFNIPEDVELMQHTPLGSPFDDRARFHLSFETDPETFRFTWVGSTFVGGTLSVELSSGGNGNGWAEVRTVGSAGLVRGGRANRDGIGAVVGFRSGGGPPVLLPVVGGSSYASQDALARHFGLGTAAAGTVEVLWPGGVRNRLYDVRAGERLDFPEIPCSFDDEDLTLRAYLGCVLGALDELVDAGVLARGERVRFLTSAVKARKEELGEHCAIDGEFKALDLGLPTTGGTGGEGGVTFADVAAGDGAGITYRRRPSESKAKFDAIKNDPPYTVEKMNETPMKAWGAPGVAIFDHDGDGDLDLYVTNGPGAANSLYSNQLRETGELAFVDRGVEAGVDATDQDSTGVCYGDLDNDGDPDLLVLSHNAHGSLFENRGDGTFADVTEASGIAAGEVRVSTSCSLGDVNGDGLLDVAVANTFDNWDNYRGLTAERFALNQHNQLFLNAGSLVFTDVSADSGLEALAGLAPSAAGAAGLTWAIAMVDYDLDGDVDVLAADDQSGFPPAVEGGVDRGLLRLHANDGSGRLTDVSLEALGSKPGAWMGLTFGDYNCDGAMDFFATNFGDYVPFSPPAPGRRPSRWFLASGDGTFADPGVGPLVTTPFGWGTSSLDYDNDGDLDLVFHGGLDLGPGIEAGNPGVVLRNPGCTAAFEYDAAALAGSTDHVRRTVQGMAVGDLNEDGFVDVVSVSNFDIPEDVELTPHTASGSPFDATAFFHLNFEPDPATSELVWVGSTFDPGTLSVEVSSGGNGNGWVEVRTLGTVGLTRGGRVNRDGIGAVVRFRSRSLPPAGTLLPVMGGSSYSSQDALAVHFGTGGEERGTVDVLWPGGVKNRLYNVKSGERLVFPEIPCGFDDAGLTFDEYLACLFDAFDDLIDAGALGRGERVRYLMSAVRARGVAQGTTCGDP